MNDWTSEAEGAIRMCETWAAKTVTMAPCQLLLFGSAIYKGGEQFNREQSDLDIVCILPEPNAALSRLRTLKTLFHQKRDLELEMIPRLSRSTCTEPGVSIVTITELEAHANIHKSGARSFFNKNFFYDLINKREMLGLPFAGTRVMRDEYRQALEYVQKLRNEYLSVCANGTGGICDYAGTDPMPKPLLRAAAQLNNDAVDGEWYDTRLGLEQMHAILQQRRTYDIAFKKLFECVSIRRGGRGNKKPLCADDQMLLAEMLYDVAAAHGSTEEVATWKIRLLSQSTSIAGANMLFASIVRLVPDARLIGVAMGSVILTIRSSVGGFKVLSDLQRYGVLAKLLDVESAEVVRIDTDPSHRIEFREANREQHLRKHISEWQPQGAGSWRAEENEFAKYLQTQLEADSLLAGALVKRNVQVTESIGTYGSNVSYEVDFVLSWTASDGENEQIYIEISRLRSPSTFFRKVSHLLPLGRPILFVAVGDAKLLAKLEPDINRLALLNANVKVIPVTLEFPRPETVSVSYSDFADFLRAQSNEFWTLTGGNTFGVAPKCTIDELMTHIEELGTGSRLVYVFSELGDEGAYGAAVRTDWKKVPRVDANTLSQYIVKAVDGADFLYLATSADAGSTGMYLTLLPA